MDFNYKNTEDFVYKNTINFNFTGISYDVSPDTYRSTLEFIYASTPNFIYPGISYGDTGGNNTGGGSGSTDNEVNIYKSTADFIYRTTTDFVLPGISSYIKTIVEPYHSTVDYAYRNTNDFLYANHSNVDTIYFEPNPFILGPYYSGIRIQIDNKAIIRPAKLIVLYFKIGVTSHISDCYVGTRFDEDFVFKPGSQVPVTFSNNSYDWNTQILTSDPIPFSMSINDSIIVSYNMSGRNYLAINSQAGYSKTTTSVYKQTDPGSQYPGGGLNSPTLIIYGLFKIVEAKNYDYLFFYNF